jgi:hypothetical protein
MAKKKSISWKTKQDIAVKGILGDYPIRDAKTPFRFTVKQNDVEHAAQKDPHNCAIAKAVERYTGIKAIAIYATVAYIPFDKRGDDKHIIERFTIDRPTKEAIALFDTTGKFQAGEYKFNPPSRSAKLGAQSRFNKHKRAKALQKVNAVRPARWGENAPKPKWLGVRNGTGQVRFTELKENTGK